MASNIYPFDPTLYTTEPTVMAYSWRRQHRTQRPGRARQYTNTSQTKAIYKYQPTRPAEYPAGITIAQSCTEWRTKRGLWRWPLDLVWPISVLMDLCTSRLLWNLMGLYTALPRALWVMFVAMAAPAGSDRDGAVAIYKYQPNQGNL